MSIDRYRIDEIKLQTAYTGTVRIEEHEFNSMVQLLEDADELAQVVAGYPHDFHQHGEEIEEYHDDIQKHLDFLFSFLDANDDIEPEFLQCFKDSLEALREDHKRAVSSVDALKKLAEAMEADVTTLGVEV